MYRKKSAYRFETFTRPAKGERIISVRFFAEDGLLITTRSTGCTDQSAASAVIVDLLQTLDLEEMEKAKRLEKEETKRGDDRFASMPIATFLDWYWSADGHYVQDRKEAGQPLSSGYLKDAHNYLKFYISTWPEFRTTLLSCVSFAIVDRFFRAAKKFPRASDPEKVPSRDMIENMMNTIRGPLNWAAARGYCKNIDFSEILLPQATNRKRGLLTDEEIEKILALPVQSIWEAKDGTLHAEVKPRPKLVGFKDGAKNKGIPDIDIRMKAYVLLGPFCGFRRGEERGLRWKSVHLEEGFIRIENNYVRGDGDKAPKADSYGDIPLAPELEVVLWELKQVAESVGFGGLDNYVLFNPSDPSVPIAEATLYRGWTRILSMIGISDTERKTRHLVPHGTRHRFATKLLDSGMTPAEAAHYTRHKTIAMLEHYADHLSDETKAKAIEAIRGRK